MNVASPGVRPFRRGLAERVDTTRTLRYTATDRFDGNCTIADSTFQLQQTHIYVALVRHKYPGSLPNFGLIESQAVHSTARSAR